MICAACQSENNDEADACFTCGKALYVLTQGMLLVNRYEILTSLGQGGMGRVYKAHDRVLDEDVAIKVLRFEVAPGHDLARRFLSEIKLSRKISHPNVARIHEYGEHAGIRFISMEYIDGLTLQDVLKAGPLSREAAFDVAIQAAQGLQAVHDHNVIHRDFKTSNIMIDSRGVARLVDFGIAKLAEQTTSHTTTGHVIGTPEYMSPEQIQGSKVDLRSDIYALGCVLYEIFAGEVPFRGESAVVTVMKQLHDPVPMGGPAAARIPPSVASIIQRAMAKKPSERHPRVAQLTEALRAARHTEGLAEPITRPLAARVGEVSARFSQAPASAPAFTVDPALLVPLSSPTPRAGSRPRETSTTRRGPGGTRFIRARDSLDWKTLWPWALLPFMAGAAWVAFRGETTETTPPVVLATDVPSSSTTASVPAGGALSPAAPGPTVSAEPVVTSPASLPPRVSPRPPSPGERTAELGASPVSSVALPSPRPRTASPRVTLPPAPTGTLRLLIVPESEVVIDGSSLGRVASREVSLSEGAHVVRILHADYEPLQRKVTIPAGGTTQLVIDLAEKGIRRR